MCNYNICTWENWVSRQIHNPWHQHLHWCVYVATNYDPGWQSNEGWAYIHVLLYDVQTSARSKSTLLPWNVKFLFLDNCTWQQLADVSTRCSHFNCTSIATVAMTYPTAGSPRTISLRVEPMQAVPTWPHCTLTGSMHGQHSCQPLLWLLGETAVKLFCKRSMDLHHQPFVQTNSYGLFSA